MLQSFNSSTNAIPFSTVHSLEDGTVVNLFLMYVLSGAEDIVQILNC